MCGLWQRSREEPMKPNSEDVNRRMLIERANAKREKWVSAIDTTFDHIGGCLRTILTDKNKLVVAVGGVTALATGIYTTREGARVVWSYVDRILGQPSLIRESSRGKYPWSGIYSRTMSAISSGGNRSSGSQNGKGFGDVILHHSLQKRIEQLANATANIKTHQAPFRNMLFRKTMAARELARKSGRKIDMQVLQRSGACTITQSTTILAVPMTTYSASFHSSNVLFEKWKNKFNFDVRGDWKQPKSNIRFTVRQKRADAKKALNGVLFNGGSSARRAESFTKIEADYTDRVNKKSRLKPAHQSKKIFNKKLKRKHHREKLSEDFDDDPETLYYATFGKQGFRVPRKGFDWTENSSWSSYTYDEHDAKSRRGSHHESFVLGTYADRKVLGLPTAGPLRIEDVKAAFRSSALKWHPDRHQGPSQAAAEEKFKQCVDAYKSLCTTLSSP